MPFRIENCVLSIKIYPQILFIAVQNDAMKKNTRLSFPLNNVPV